MREVPAPLEPAGVEVRGGGAAVAAPAGPQPPTIRAALAGYRARFGEREPAVAAWASLGPEAYVWVVLLLAIPALTILLDLSTGVLVDILPFVDADYFWHLATGEWILDNREIPTTDPFSWTYGGREWIAHEWLAEVILALTVRAGDYAGAVLFTWVVSVAGFWRLMAAARAYGMSRRLAVLVMLLTGPAFLRAGVMVVRPQVWTFALMAVLLAELAAYDTGKRKQLWVVPVIFAVWINMNLTALIGFGCLGAFVLDRLIRPPVDRHVVKIEVLSGLALLVNPQPIGLIKLVFGYLDTDMAYRDHVFEWMPPRWGQETHLPFFIALALVIPAVVMLLRPLFAVLELPVSPLEAVRRYRPYVWPAAPLLVVAQQSLQAVRYIPVYLMLAIVFGGWLIWRWSQRSGEVPRFAQAPLFPRRRWVAAPPLIAGALALLIVTQADQSQFRRNPDAYGHPVEVAEVYVSNFPGRRMFNTYDFGSYLIYRFLGTENKVYMDGRAEMYGNEIMNEYFYYIGGNPGWQQYMDAQGIEVIIVRWIDGLSNAAANDPGWRQAYANQAHVIFVRR